jgi:hypothetical protein
MNHKWLWLEPVDIQTELTQALEEGRDLSALAEEFERVAGLDLSLSENQSAAAGLLDRVQLSPMRGDYEYVEPMRLDEIVTNDDFGAQAVDGFANRMLGAWTGRCCGCLLGKPIEGWSRERITQYLMETGQWPLSDYISMRAPKQLSEKYALDMRAPFKENISCMPEDDDLNYTVCGLMILESHGPEFTSSDVGRFWLEHLPLLRLCTAERVAYQNLAAGIDPPYSANLRNPYREWIGAQIRADMWGYANPGMPARAASMAFRDATVSHVRNGIYGEMWAAGMIASAFTLAEIPDVIRAGLACIPARSRLAERIGFHLSLFEPGGTEQDSIEAIHERWNEHSPHDWCHVISNAEVVAASLLHGRGDFSATVRIAVSSGFDTDCNGATCGSILGAMFGADAIPTNWTTPLNDTLMTGVLGSERVRISELAERTSRIAKRDGT